MHHHHHQFENMKHFSLFKSIIYWSKSAAIFSNVLLLFAACNVYANNIPTFLTEPSNSDVVENLSIEIYCMASGLPIPRIVSWMKDGRHVNFDGRLSLLNTGSLKISNAARGDTGYYQCVAQNAVGSVISRRAKLDVACKHMSQMFLFLLSSLFLTASLSGWYHSEKVMELPF